MYITASELYRRLSTSGILDASGEANLSLLGVEVKINEKSAMGDLIQERLGAWMANEGITFRTKDNSQEFPDFMLDELSDTKGLLEVKTFDYDKTPNFDVANFEAYVRSLETHAYRIDADYLILGYTLHNGILRIRQIWLKKIWEICCPSEKFPIKTQCKQDMIYNIRPANLKSSNTKFPIFGSKENFLNAIHATLSIYPKTATTHQEWYTTVIANHKKYLGE